MFARDTKILVVDDMETMLNIIKKNLYDLGLRNLVEADNGEEAWDEVGRALDHNTPIQLIISDWHMPRMQGIDLLRKVRSHSQTKSTPFIMVLAETEKAQIAEAIHSGVSDCIFKPIDSTKFAEKLFALWQKIQQSHPK